MDKAPREHREIHATGKKGLILIYTGDGKGKSTAAFGTALRALGHGYKVAVVQFIKGGWKTGEQTAARTFGDSFQIFSMGEGFTWQTKDFDRDAKTAQKAWSKCLEILADERFQLVIFDEINYALQYNFLGVTEVAEALRTKPAHKHVILTGNFAPPELIELADLVTEMKCLKHPYPQGILAQPGIEF